MDSYAAEINIIDIKFEAFAALTGDSPDIQTREPREEPRRDYHFLWGVTEE